MKYPITLIITALFFSQVVTATATDEETVSQSDTAIDYMKMEIKRQSEIRRSNPEYMAREVAMEQRVMFLKSELEQGKEWEEIIPEDYKNTLTLERIAEIRGNLKGEEKECFERKNREEFLEREARCRAVGGGNFAGGCGHTISGSILNDYFDEYRMKRCGIELTEK